MAYFSGFSPATLQISNSTIQPWLDFNGTVPAGFPRCKPDLSPDYEDSHNNFIPVETGQDRCLYACNATYLRNWTSFDPNTISTCGMWVSLMIMGAIVENLQSYIYNKAPDMAVLEVERQYITDQLRRFDGPLIGLGHVDTTYISMVQGQLFDFFWGFLPWGNDAGGASSDVAVACATIFPARYDISEVLPQLVNDWALFMDPLH